MRFAHSIILAVFMTALAFQTQAQGSKIQVTHALAFRGEIAYGPDAKHLETVNPNAPKGGELRLQSTGGFDSFNPHIVRGNPAAGIGLIYESLLEQTPGEQLVSYGLLAEKIELPEDRSWVAFTIRDAARWHDGKPITAEDVVWSFETLQAKGQPFYRLYYRNVAKVEAIETKKVKFTFQGNPSLELPIIIGQMPVLPKHYWAGRDFEKTTLEPPLGSGPYRIKSFEANRFVIYERVADHWGQNHFLNKGRNNFDRIRYDSYRDTTVVLEAFKAGEYDFRQESSSRDWATGYDFPAVKSGQVKREEVKSERSGMQAYVLNQRREKFQDPRVREAFDLAMDFEWTNKNLFYGYNTRTNSYFSNSNFVAKGLPGAAELKLLEPFRQQVPAQVFEKEYAGPITDGSGNNRDNLRKATALLTAAGWKVKNGVLSNSKGQPLEFEVILVQPEFERVVSPYLQSLDRLGIKGKIRILDSAQYQNRLREYDFDMIIGSWPQSASPGNEQREFFGASAADRPGGRNTAGIKNPVVDALVEKVIEAPDLQALTAATRALDRVLLWNHYVVPQWHRTVDWIAYWDKFGRPDKKPKYGVDFMSWWIDPVKESVLKRNGGTKP